MFNVLKAPFLPLMNKISRVYENKDMVLGADLEVKEALRIHDG